MPLVLTPKVGESVYMLTGAGEEIVVTIIRSTGEDGRTRDAPKLSITAPRSVRISRTLGWLPRQREPDVAVTAP